MPATENRLARETSPYLRQHSHDPVDWFPWGDEAFERAAELDRPLFLSIGYSACHWCHVMGHESFADPVTAAEMNDLVVSVKVDREERPDVDAVYMEAVQAATGHGGWPMSVFATPDGRPFFAGTYFPNRSGGGAPSFRAVLAAVSDAWTTKRQDLDAQADGLTDAVAKRLAPPAGSGALDRDAVSSAMESACRRLGEMHDAELGGFGRSPKFPQPLLLDLLLLAHAEGIGGDLDPGPIEMVERTLEAMASGGIWDQVGGGFSRYSVDRHWLVPHFEKMLYDQALLARVYLHAWQLTGDARWRQVLEEIVEYTMRDLRTPSGGLASAEDADSEGAEGLFYVWTPAEITAVLGPELAPVALEWWGVEPGGNFEGRSILFRAERGQLDRPPEIEEARRLLLEARSRRVRPSLDDKVLAEWNAMMCATLAEAALATGSTSWRQAAESLGDLLLGKMRRAGDGRVLRLPATSTGTGELLGYSTDVAWMLEACIRLAECTGAQRWLEGAKVMARQLRDLFTDSDSGGLFTTGSDAESLVVRPREVYDNVTPSAASVAASGLARLAVLTGDDELARQSGRILASASLLIERAPTAVPGLVAAADLLAEGAVEIVIAGDRSDLVAEAARRFVPRRTLAWTAPGETSSSPVFQGKAGGLGYVCRFGACRLPSSTPEQLGREIDAASTR